MPEKRNDEALLKEMHEDYDYATEAWREQQEAARQDARLMANKPFTAEEVARRGPDRPLVLTDVISQYTNQIINNIRQNPRGVNVEPADLEMSRDQAAKIANWARGIERDSDAQAVYSTAFEGAVAYGGMGFMRYVQEYESNDTDRQRIKLVRIPNHASILPDPDCKNIDFSDMRFCFVLDRIRHNSYQQEYPNGKLKKSQDFKDAQSERPRWCGSNDLQVAEWWKVRYTDDTILVMESGSLRLSKVRPGSQWKPDPENMRGGGILVDPMGVPVLVVASRKIRVPSVVQYHTNGFEILDEAVWDEDSDSIPIYPVVGREMYVEEGGQYRKIYVSAVRFCSWAVKGMAYVRSLQTELAQMTPKTPWMAIEGQLDGYEDQWQKIHTDPMAFAYYRARLEEFPGAILPPPQRMNYEPAIQALQMLYDAFHQDLQNALGMYKASVGNQAGSSSGKMVQELDKQSDQGSFHFTHNFNQSLERMWTDIVKRRKKVYDTVRDVPGVQADGTPVPIRINDPSDPEALDMTTGDPAVRISVGPAMESEMEDARNLAETLAQIPGVFDKIGHLLVKMAGKGPIVDQIADALKPQGADMSPQQLQAQLQQAMAQNQQIKAALQEALQTIDTKKLDLESRERIAALNALAGIRKAEISKGVPADPVDAVLQAQAVSMATEQPEQPMQTGEMDA